MYQINISSDIFILEPVIDNFGNLYLTYGDQLFEFNIDRLDNLELYKINTDLESEFKFKIFDNNYLDNTKELLLATKSKTLKGKVIHEYIKDKNKNKDRDLDHDLDPELDPDLDQEIDKYYDYCPEDLEFLNHDSNSEQESESEFEFMGSLKIKRLVEILNNNNININNSIYGTYIYTGEPDNSELVFVSKMRDIILSYRIFIYQNGTVILKIIGGIKKYYKIEKNEDNIILKNKN